LLESVLFSGSDALETRPESLLDQTNRRQLDGLYRSCSIAGQIASGFSADTLRICQHYTRELAAGSGWIFQDTAG
jgi:hypothetical protein